MRGAVEVEDLVVRYSGRAVVDGLSLSVRPGIVCAVLGPNGAGKTTSVEVCEGYRRPASGDVRVLGLDPRVDGARLRPRVGVVLQDGAGLPQGARPGELVRLYAALHAHPHPPAELLDRLGLSEVAGTPVRRLSGGQRQRLSVALAVVGRPELVFLDEPTSGLDPQARHGVWDLVDGLRRDGVTVVLTTHQMAEAERLADDVVIVDRGRVLASGTAQEVMRGGAEGQIRFRSAAGLPVGTLLAALPEGSRAKEESAGQYLVEAEVDPHVLASVTAWCAGQGHYAHDLRVESRSLEDVFLDLTGRELRA